MGEGGEEGEEGVVVQRVMAGDPNKERALRGQRVSRGFPAYGLRQESHQSLAHSSDVCVVAGLG